MKASVLPNNQQAEVETLIKYLALSEREAALLRLTANSLFMAGKQEGIEQMMEIVQKPTK